MRLGMMTVTVLLCVFAVGCQENVQNDSKTHAINSQLVKSYNDIAIQNAIVSQHTLFPYHFIENGAELNELGQKDIAALTSHFIKHPGHLNIRKHNTPAALYKARVNVVHKSLIEAGIDKGRISISDDMPGGPGITSERVLVILQQEPKRASTGATTSITTGIK